MKLLISTILMLAVTACVYAEAQPENNFRAGGPQPSYDDKQVSEGRFIFKTVSVTLQTLTITSTTTSVSTCTTSTAGLSVCTASGRRRRGLHLSGNKEGRGLFYNEDEEHNDDSNNVFLPQPKEESPSVESEVKSLRDGREAPSEPIPFEVQPGYEVPHGQGRVYLAFGTSTITTTSTITSIASLTAICISTTGFQVCGSQGRK